MGEELCNLNALSDGGAQDYLDGLAGSTNARGSDVTINEVQFSNKKKTIFKFRIFNLASSRHSRSFRYTRAHVPSPAEKSWTRREQLENGDARLPAFLAECGLSLIRRCRVGVTS